MLSIPKQQPANGMGSSKASEIQLGCAELPEKGPFALLQGVGGGEDAVGCWGCRYPLAHTSTCVCRRENATLSPELQLLVP